MTTRTLIGLALGALGLSLTGCNSSGGGGGGYTPKPEEKVAPITIVPGQESDLFPVKAGNTWTYEDNSTRVTGQGSASSTSEVTFKVTNVADTADGKVATIEISANGKLSDRLKWRVGPNGIYEVSGSERGVGSNALKEVAFEPPVPMVPFPVKPGSGLDVTSTGVRPAAGVGPLKTKLLVEGVQEVDTAMGRFSSLCTTSVSLYQAKEPKTGEIIKFKATSSAYWTPKVGIVRYFQEIVMANSKGQSISSTSVLRLKSHIP